MVWCPLKALTAKVFPCGAHHWACSSSHTSKSSTMAFFFSHQNNLFWCIKPNRSYLEPVFCELVYIPDVTFRTELLILYINLCFADPSSPQWKNSVNSVDRVYEFNNQSGNILLSSSIKKCCVKLVGWGQVIRKWIGGKWLTLLPMSTESRGLRQKEENIQTHTSFFWICTTLMPISPSLS